MPFSYSTAECANANANLFNSRYRLQARVASPCRSSSTHQALCFPLVCLWTRWKIKTSLKHSLFACSKTDEQDGWDEIWAIWLATEVEIHQESQQKHNISGYDNAAKKTFSFSFSSSKFIKGATSRKKRKSTTTCVRQLKALELYPDSPLLGLLFGWSCLTTRRSTSL